MSEPYFDSNDASQSLASNQFTAPVNDCSRFRFSKPLAIVAVVVVLLACGLVAWRWQSGKQLTFFGVVESQEVRLSSKVGGRIAEIFVQEGDVVEAGCVLVRFDAPELLAEQSQRNAQLRMARAKLELAHNSPLPEQVESAEASLAVAEAKLADLQAGYRDEEIAQARLDVQVMESEVERATSEHARLRHLVANRVVSVSEYESARTLMQSAEGKLGIARQRLTQLESGSRKEAVAEARAHVRKMKAELDFVKRGPRDEELEQLEAQVQEAEARIEDIEARLAETIVVAPDTCLVEVLSVRRGQIVAPNEPVVRIRASEDHWIKAFVPETELAHVQLNQTVTLTRDGDHRRYSGQVIHVASASEFTPRNIQSINERQHQVFAIKIKPDTIDGTFKSGMAAKVLIKPSHRPADAQTVKSTPRPASDSKKFVTTKSSTRPARQADTKERAAESIELDSKLDAVLDARSEKLAPQIDAKAE